MIGWRRLLVPSAPSKKEKKKKTYDNRTSISDHSLIKNGGRNGEMDQQNLIFHQNGTDGHSEKTPEHTSLHATFDLHRRGDAILQGRIQAVCQNERGVRRATEKLAQARRVRQGTRDISRGYPQLQKTAVSSVRPGGYQSG